MNFKIKKADISDIESIQEISILTFKETFIDVNTKQDIKKYISSNLSIENLTKELKNKYSIFYIVKDIDKTIAYMKLNLKEAQTEDKYDNSLELQRIYILKQYKRKNIGKTLMNIAIDTAKQKNLDYIWLGVWNKNYEAIKFYEKCGFEIFENHIFKVGNSVRLDPIMKLKL